jgi:hypothetical protein
VNAAADVPSGFYRVKERSIWLDPPSILADGTVELVVHNTSNPRIEVQFSGDLVNWISLMVLTNAGSTSTNFDDFATNSSVRFYRVLAPP